MLVSEPGAPLIRPPDETFSTPPAYTSTLLVTVPSTFAVPPLDTAKWDAVPPADTFRVPPLDTAK
jgi:hypothetical protein